MAPVKTPQVQIGLDVGQRVDPTAIAVVEVENRAPAPTPERVTFVNGQPQVQRATAPPEEWHFVVRHLERLPLGTPYPAVAERVAVVVVGVVGLTGQTPTLFVDATGVGQPLLVTALGLAVQPPPPRFVVY